MTGKLSNFLESNTLLPSSQFSYKKDLGTCDALLTLSHTQQCALNRGMNGKLLQLNFSAAFSRVIHRGLVHKLRSIGARGRFLFIISEFLSHRRQSMHFDDTVSASVDVASGVSLQGTVILYISDLFHIVGNHMVSYANDYYYALVLRPLSPPQVMESLKQNLAPPGNQSQGVIWQSLLVIEVAHEAQL